MEGRSFAFMVAISHRCQDDKINDIAIIFRQIGLATHPKTGKMAVVYNGLANTGFLISVDRVTNAQ